MKVILIKDVARLGRRSDVKNVPDGHALNFLIPRKLAIIATPESMKRLKEETHQHDMKKGKVLDEFNTACKALAEKPVSYVAEANEKGNLFKGVNADDISKHLASLGIIMPKENIVLDHPIKEVGMHAVPLRFGGSEGVCQLEIVKK